MDIVSARDSAYKKKRMQECGGEVNGKRLGIWNISYSDQEMKLRVRRRTHSDLPTHSRRRVKEQDSSFLPGHYEFVGGDITRYWGIPYDTRHRYFYFPRSNFHGSGGNKTRQRRRR